MTGLSLLGRHGNGADGVAPLAPGATPSAIAATTLSAVLRAVAAVLAGLVLVSGAALVLWALTPGGDVESAVAVRGGAVALAAAHFLPVSFSSVAVTIRPLLLTGLMIAVVATSAGRARMVRGRLLEALHVSVFVVFYAVGIDVASAVLPPAGTVRAGLGGPLAVATMGALAALAFHATAWRQWWQAYAPPWLQAGLRAGLVTTLALLTAGAAALVVGLVAAFPSVSTVAGLTVGSPGDALGMTLLCLALLPNAVIAAVGYVSGAGFGIGAATFSPLAVHRAELPAVPLLAAAPEHASAMVTWIVLMGPVVAAALGGVLILRGTGTRRGRLAGCGVGALFAAASVLLLTSIGGGGVAGGAWASAGAPPLITAGMVAGITAVVMGALAVSTGWRELPWSVPIDHDVVLGAGAVPDDSDGAETHVAATDSDADSAPVPEDAVTPDSPADAVTLDTAADAERNAPEPTGAERNAREPTDAERNVPEPTDAERPDAGTDTGLAEAR